MKQNGFFAEVIKTDIICVDDSSHELPPHKGAYSEFKVADYFCPDEWSKDGIFISVKEGEPLWFDFRRNSDECAILCSVQRVNPVTGEPADLDGGLSKDPAQNYLRMPEQRWLDGYAKSGKVYQFVVTKAGVGLAVNEFVLPAHMQDSHAIGFAFFGPKNPKPKPVSTLRSGGISHYGNCTKGGMKSAKLKSKSKSMWVSGYTGGGIYESGLESLKAGGIGEIKGICGGGGGDPSLGDEMMGSGANDFEPECGNETFCCANVDEAIPMAAGGAVEETVEERVNCNQTIGTVDILAAQEANLAELDKASMAPGGRIAQSIHTDDNTTDYYHEKRSALLTIYFALPEMYDAIMKKGKRQDASKKDKYKTSGHIGGVAVPLITQAQIDNEY